jgi:ribonucleoside-diphosphate reductase subunit M2
MSDSPAKKLDFAAMDKENIPVTVEPTAVESDLKKPITEVVQASPQAPKVAPTIKPTEADEPLLQENPQRFVLFPIKYHEVRARLDASSDCKGESN